MSPPPNDGLSVNGAAICGDTISCSLIVPVPLVNGFQSDAGDRWGRSVTSIPGPDGSLYVTDDDAGPVYRITPGS